ncbi:MAG: hypothetical protein E6F99_28065 [Actinobacteria bacterium]|nr:MAG: hypothetical protein E6F99_28065 [Actinomycetota bacterium]
MKFAMLVNNNEAEFDDLTPEVSDARMKELYAWFEKWETAGKVIDGGAHLQRTTTAKTVRPGADGGVTVTDGPYLELKEVVCGVVLLEADDIDDAVAVASTWPQYLPSGSVEVRPIYLH